MYSIGKLLTLTISLFILSNSVLHAANEESTKPIKESKGWFGWGQWHGGFYDHGNSRNSDFVPYAENGRNEHMTYNQDIDWSPEDWAVQYDDIYELIENFYEMNVLKSQKVEDDIPILTVGTGFYNLSGKDKYKLMRYLDYVYGMSKTGKNSYFRIRDWYSEGIIGIYSSKHGLQLQ